MSRIVIKNISEIDSAAAEFLKETQNTKVYAFYGSMGAGKTTFISALCGILGVENEVASPTFTIVNEYRTEDGKTLYHFDFYRINNIQEVLDIGYEEYMCDDAISFMEWPEKVEGILPEDALKVHIDVGGDDERIITF